MTLAKLIKKLQAIHREHGDLIVQVDDWEVELAQAIDSNGLDVASDGDETDVQLVVLS